MKVPKFLIADCYSQFPDNAYVVHTEKPRFIMDAESEEYVMLDGSDPADEAMPQLIVAALEFYDNELSIADEELDEDDEEYGYYQE